MRRTLSGEVLDASTDFNATSSPGDSCVDADEWDAHLSGDGVLCLDKTRSRIVYACGVDSHGLADMTVKVLVPPVSLTEDPGKLERLMGAARERRERLGLSSIAAIDDVQLDSHEGRGGESLACIVSYTGIAVDTRCRLIGQSRPLPAESRSVLDIVGFCRPSKPFCKSDSVNAIGGASQLRTEEIQALLKVIAEAAWARLCCNSTVLGSKAPTSESCPLVHGNLSPGNIFISPNRGTSVQVTFVDPLDGFTFPMTSLDSSAFSLAHLRYIRDNILCPVVAAAAASLQPYSLEEEMHLRYEEHPYIPTARDDVHAMGALAYFLITGHTIRHGMSVPEASLVLGEVGGDEGHAQVIRRVLETLSGASGETTRRSAFIEMALQFIDLTVFSPNNGVSMLDVLNHPFLSDRQLPECYPTVCGLMADVESNIETYRMFAGSGPLQLRQMRNVFLNHSALAFRNILALAPSEGVSLQMGPLQRLRLIFPPVGRVIDMVVSGQPVPDVSELLHDVLPSRAIRIEISTGSLVIEGADGLDWTVSDDMLRAIAVMTVSFDYLVQISRAALADHTLNATAVCIQFCAFASQLFSSCTEGVFSPTSLAMESQQHLPTGVASTFSTFITTVRVINCTQCSIGLLFPTETLVVENISNSRLFFGPTKMAMVNSAVNCEPIAIAADSLFLEGDISDCVFSLHLADNPRCSSVSMETLVERAMASGPRIPEVKSGEECLRNVQFIPYVVSYDGCFEQFQRLHLTKEHQATRLSFPGLDVMRERQMFDLTPSSFAEGTLADPSSMCCFGHTVFFFDYFQRSSKREMCRNQISLPHASELAKGLLPLTDYLCRSSSLDNVAISYSDYILPRPTVRRAAEWACVLGTRSLCDYPFLPSICHGMIYRHSGNSDLFIGPGEATNWSFVISDIQGARGCHVHTRTSDRIAHYLSSLKGSIADHTDAVFECAQSDAAIDTGFPVIFILEAIDDVTIVDVSECTIIVLAAASTIRCKNVSKCKLYLACRGLISFENCSRLEAYGYSTHPCVVSDSSSQIHIFPLLLDVPHSEDIFSAVGVMLDGEAPLLADNLFSDIPADKDIIVTQKPSFAFSLRMAHEAPPSGILCSSAAFHRGLDSFIPRIPVGCFLDFDHTSTEKTVGVQIKDFVDCSILRMRGSLSPIRHNLSESLHVDNLEICGIDGGVIHVADSVGCLHIRNCTGPLDIIVAVSQSVVVDSCEGVTLQTACFDFLATNCHGCHFSLHVNSQPKIADGHSYWESLQAVDSECRSVVASAKYGMLNTPPSLFDCVTLSDVETYSLLDSLPCSNLRFSALNITCDIFEELLESSCIQLTPNLYDRPVLVRLPPPPVVRHYFAQCETFLRSACLPTPPFASPMRSAAAPVPLTCWPMEDSLSRISAGRINTCHDVASPHSLTSFFAPGTVDRPVISPFGFKLHAHGAFSRSLVCVFNSIKSIFLSRSQSASFSSSEMTRVVSLLSPVFGALADTLLASNVTAPSTFGRIEDTIFASRSLPEQLDAKQSGGVSLSCFDNALLICPPLQGTVVGGLSDLPFVDSLSARVEDDASLRFEPFVRLLGRLKWLIDSSRIASDPPTFDSLSLDVVEVLMASVVDPFDELKRLAVLSMSTACSFALGERLAPQIGQKDLVHLFGRLSSGALNWPFEVARASEFVQGNDPCSAPLCPGRGVSFPAASFGDWQLLEAFSTEPGLISSMRERTEAQKKRARHLIVQYSASKQRLARLIN